MQLFRTWLESTLHNKADLVLPAIQQAGPDGITLRRLVKDVSLDVWVVAALIDALVGTGVVLVRGEGKEVRVRANYVAFKASSIG